MSRKWWISIGITFIALSTGGCHENSKTIKVMASPSPHAEILEETKPELAKQGIELDIIKTDDYQLPNRALSEGEIDANYFQHVPFLEYQEQEFGYQLSVLAKVHIEPMGIYSKTVHAISQLPEYGVVAIPSDPVNQNRALILLQQAGLIQLNQVPHRSLNLLNITDNPKKLILREVDAPMMPGILPDVAAAVMPTNVALEAGFDPEKDALFKEDASSPYVNVIVVRTKDLQDPQLQALKKAVQSEKVRLFIKEKYHGAVVPAFSSIPSDSSQTPPHIEPPAG